MVHVVRLQSLWARTASSSITRSIKNEEPIEESLEDIDVSVAAQGLLNAVDLVWSPGQNEETIPDAEGIQDLGVRTANTDRSLIFSDYRVNGNNDNSGTGEDLAETENISTLIRKAVNFNGRQIHYIRVGHIPCEQLNKDDIECLNIVLARVNAVVDSVDIVLMDASVVSGVQYGHCDLGANIDLDELTWIPDSCFAGQDDQSEFEQLLLDTVKGDFWVRDVDWRQRLLSMAMNGIFQATHKRLQRTVELVILPVKPNYHSDGGLSVLGDFVSKEDILCVLFFINTTSIQIDFDGLMNK